MMLPGQRSLLIPSSMGNTDKHGWARMDADNKFIRVHPCASVSIRVAIKLVHLEEPKP
jgi:hypothetical protein